MLVASSSQLAVFEPIDRKIVKNWKFGRESCMTYRFLKVNIDGYITNDLAQLVAAISLS
jgi:hypothetical protein